MTDDAAALAAEASGGDPGEAMSRASPDEGSTGDGSARRSVMGALMHTEPDESPGDYPDLPTYTAHAVIGSKKVINYFTDDVGKGTPAIVNFGMVPVELRRERSDETDGGSTDRGSAETDDGADVQLHGDHA